MTITTMRIDALECTSSTQIRVKLNKDTIDQYQEDLEDGAVFPPVIAFAEKGSSRIIVSDGFHRILSHVNAGIEEIDVDIREGKMVDALLYALSANRVHGLRRTNADKINAVQLALKDPAISQHTQREIADICGVSIDTVRRTEHKQTGGRYDNSAKPVSPEPNTPENNRPTKPEPTQEEIERGEVRQALGLIKALPYPGKDAGKLVFDGDDIKDLEYCSGWLAHAFLAAKGE